MVQVSAGYKLTVPLTDTLHKEFFFIFVSAFLSVSMESLSLVMLSPEPCCC